MGFEWPWLYLIRPSFLFSLLIACAVCSCSKNSPKTASPFQPPAGGGTEQVENRIQGLLSRLNVRQNEVANLRRVADRGMTDEQRDRARTAREGFYSRDKYIVALRAAQAAVETNMTGLTLERAILENAAAPPATNHPAGPTNVPPDERVEEMNLKARLVELQLLTLDLSQSEPPPGRIAPQVREKAAAARDDLFSADQYAESLGTAATLMESKLRGLDAEAAFYEDALGLNSKTSGKR